MTVAWRGNNSPLARHAEDSANMYFVPGRQGKGAKSFKYVLVKASLHRAFMAALAGGTLPDYAIVVEEGLGEPSELIRQKMRLLYGFEH